MALADKARTIRMPVHIVERLQKLNKAERMLWTQLGREPTLEEVAEEASLPIEQAQEVKAAAHASTSLDQPVGSRKTRSSVTSSPATDRRPTSRWKCCSVARRSRVRSARWSDRENVLILRYGLDNLEPKTLEEIGRRLDLTRERVRQIEGQALKRLSRLNEIESVG